MIFVEWAVFLKDSFSQLNQNKGYLFKKIPDIFIKTEHGMTGMVIDCTEFNFHHAAKLDLNSLLISNCKNTLTGKVLIGILPHGKDFY